MRVLMTTSGGSGRLLPMVPFARACLRAGHEVRVAAQRARGTQQPAIEVQEGALASRR